MLWLGFGAAAAAAADATISFLDTDDTSTNASSYTFSSISIGAAAADRFVIVGAATIEQSGLGATINSITLNGNAMTLLARATDTAGSSNRAGAALFGLTVNSNTTATIVVGLSQESQGCAIAVWKANGLSSTTPNDTLTATDANPLTGTIDVQAGGVCVGMVGWSSPGEGAQTTTWTGLTTEDVDDSMGSEPGKSFSAAHLASAAGSSGMTVTADPSGTPEDGGRALAVVALR